MYYYYYAERVGLAAFACAIALHLEGKAVLVWLLLAFSALDWATGVIAAFKHDGLDSRTAFWGFVKKLCGFIGVGVAVGIDVLVSYGMERFQLDFPATPFGLLALCYLTLSEAISILENLGEVGVDVPFLKLAVKAMRAKIKE